MLELPIEMMGNRGLIHPTVIWDADDVVLVDTGVPGSAVPIREACEHAGVPYDRLNHIILTHDDIDHIGSLGAIVHDAAGTIEVLAHREEVATVESGRPAKMTPERLASMPENRRQIFERVLGIMNSQPVRVTRSLADGETLPYCGGITVIHTPGHTPGHIALFLQQSRTLIAGDALVLDGGVLRPSSPALSHDAQQAVASTKQLAAFDIASVICYHGGLYQDEPNARIADMWQSVPASK
jgi:glyoxylase-like metal-dependent hydrolase (beta-lactamase superfamily II)